MLNKYFIFAINREFFDTYKDNEKILFKTLNNLYNLKIREAPVGISVYHQLCNPINKDIIYDYFNSNNKFQKIGEKSRLEINYSCLILETRGKIPKKIKSMNYYESPLFVIDFKNSKYFWLN